MNRTLRRLACLLTLWALPVLAHDFWIEPSSYQVPADGKVTIRFRVGEHFRGEPLPLDPKQVVVFSRFGPKTERPVTPDFHFSFGSANHRVASDAFIDAGWKALKALRRATPNG